MKGRAVYGRPVVSVSSVYAWINSSVVDTNFTTNRWPKPLPRCFMIMCQLQEGRCRAGMQMTDDKVCRPRIKVPSPTKTVMNLPSGITVTEGILQDSFIVRHYNHVGYTNGAGWVCGILTRYPSSDCIAGGWGWGVSVCMWWGGGGGRGDAKLCSMLFCFQTSYSYVYSSFLFRQCQNYTSPDRYILSVN